MVDRPECNRPKRRLDSDPFCGVDKLLAVGRLGFSENRCGALEHCVADHRAQPGIVIVFRLVSFEKGGVVRDRNRVPRIAGHDPSHRRLILERVEIFRLASEQAYDRAILEEAARYRPRARA